MNDEKYGNTPCDADIKVDCTLNSDIFTYKARSSTMLTKSKIVTNRKRHKARRGGQRA